MASHLSVSLSRFGRWENGKVLEMPPADKYIAWCFRLGVNIRYGMGMVDSSELPVYPSERGREVLRRFEMLDVPGQEASLAMLGEVGEALRRAAKRPRSPSGGRDS